MAWKVARSRHSGRRRPARACPIPSWAACRPGRRCPRPAFRNGLQAQLLAERDRTQRVAADTPIPPVPPVPPPIPQAATAALPPNGVPGPGAGLAPDFNEPLAPGEPTLAAASLATAEAPPAPVLPAKKPTAPQAAALGADGLPAGPPAGTKLTIVGDAMDTTGVPDLPAAPPAPASFEGVAAQPAPSVRVLPAGLGGTPAGTQLFFPAGGDVLQPSQMQALRDFVSHRRHQTISIIGLGETASDTPDGQARAVALGLRRAQSVAAALAALHVPQSALRVSARAFGSGAVLQLSS